MDVNAFEILAGYNDHPNKTIQKAVTSFFHTRYYKDAMKLLKLKTVRYLYCRSKTDEELAYYIMGTKKKPMIVLHDRVLKRFAKKIGKDQEKPLVYITLLHEMAHAYLDCKGLTRQSELVVHKFSLKAVKKGVPAAMDILKKYLDKRGKV